MKILVTGGAGYIGSFMTQRLLDEKYEVVIVDSLERGNRKNVDSRAQLKIGNILDENFIKGVFKDDKFDGIIHFAGYISMGESMEKPELYFENNTFATLKLLEQAVKHDVNKIIFSSTAGVYGNPVQTPIPEDHPKNPENPYSDSKLQTEKILSWYQKIYGISFTALRYFNACGASLNGSSGESHNPETHIIPNAIHAAINSKPFDLYGTDYDTTDGTCIRDYIHVLDLVDAHILALNKLENSKGGFYYNVGTGKGFSNKEVLQMVKKVSGIDFTINYAERRPGDAGILIADQTRIAEDLGFVPKFSDLETIVKSAWAYHSKNEK